MILNGAVVKPGKRSPSNLRHRSSSVVPETCLSDKHRKGLQMRRSRTFGNAAVATEGEAWLNTIICLWEDRCFWDRMRGNLAEREGKSWPVSHLVGGIRNWQDFRDFLLVGDSGGHRITNFLTHTMPPSQDVFGNMLPLSLHEWYSSAIIYQPDLQMQEEFQTTALETVTWSATFRRLFQSFAINLAKPLVDSNGNRQHFVLVHLVIDSDRTAVLNLQVFGTRADGIWYEPLRLDKRRAIENWLEDGSFAEIKREFALFRENSSRMFWAHWTLSELDPDKVIGVQLKLSSGPDLNGVREPWTTIMRIITGVILHLQSGTTGELRLLSPLKKRRPFRSPGRKAITDRVLIVPISR
jgi:hypothetical protein